MKVEEAYSLIWKVLMELIKANLKIVREIPAPSGSLPRKPSYVLLEYKLGLTGMSKREIELRFEDKQTRTVVSLKWFYPTYKTESRLTNALIWDKKAKSDQQTTIAMVEELKSRVGATGITPDQQVMAKEIIRESQVIVKVRCPYCANLYDETLDKCPYCGGKR